MRGQAWKGERACGILREIYKEEEVTTFFVQRFELMLGVSWDSPFVSPFF